jgi:hypothetical protein
MFPKRQAIELVENEDAAKEAAQLRDEQWSKKADAALKEHQAKIAATAEVESKPRHLTLALSDFSLIEGFRGFYEGGGGDYEVEPRHSVAIRAKWRHVASSEKIFLAGDEIDPETTFVFFSAASSKDSADKSHASHHGLSVYLIEDVFSALIDTVVRGDIKEAMAWVRTEPRDSVWGPRLLFGELETISHRRESPADPVHVPIPKELKRLLYLIIGLLGAILLVQLWQR